MALSLNYDIACIKYFPRQVILMRSARAVYSTLAFTLMLVAVPWTVSAGGTPGVVGDDDPVEVDTKASIKDYGAVEYEVDFRNLDDTLSYEYVIWFTRVDPDFSHFTVEGDLSPDSDHVRLQDEWIPDQDGPYTLHATISQYGSVLATGDDTFDWGDVANNSDPVAVVISASPQQDYYDVIGNESRQKAINFSFHGIYTEHNASYKLEWKIFEGSEINESYQLLRATYTNLHTSQNMSGLGDQIDGWQQDTEYTFGAWLYRVDSTNDGDVDWHVASDEWSFIVGAAPQPVSALQFSCPGDVDDPWIIPLNKTLIQNNAAEHSMQCDVTNPNDVEISGNYTIQIEQGSGMTFSTTPSAQFTMLATESSTVILTPLAWLEDNIPTETGVFLLKADIEAEDWLANQSTIRIHYLLEEEQVIIPPTTPVLEVEGSADASSGEAPFDVVFDAEISGGVQPYQITWSIEGSVLSNSATFGHTFDAEGDYIVQLVVTDGSGESNGTNLSISVSEPPPDPLLSNVSFAPQLNASALVVNASVEMFASASGGVQPYTFYWDFGDGGIGDGANVSHIFTETGNYTVVLTVVDANDQIAADSIQVNITVAKDDVDNKGDATSEESSHVEEDRADEKMQLALASGGALGLIGLFGLGHWRGKKEMDDMLDKERAAIQKGNDANLWSSEIDIDDIGGSFDDLDIDLDLDRPQ